MAAEGGQGGGESAAARWLISRWGREGVHSPATDSWRPGIRAGHPSRAQNDASIYYHLIYKRLFFFSAHKLEDVMDCELLLLEMVKVTTPVSSLWVRGDRSGQACFL